jgi:hypothetical protein
MSERESVIERVQKLLALSDEAGGGTEAERLNAAEKAQDLILKHNLDVLEIEAEQNTGPEFVEDFEDFDKMTDHWKGSLFAAIGKTVNVQTLYRSGSSKSQRRYILIGRQDSIEYARSLTNYLVPFLETECEAALIKSKDDGETTRCSRCQGYGLDPYKFGSCSSCKGVGQKKVNARVFRNSFYDSAVSRIRTRLIERKREQEETGDFSTALVRNDEAALDRFVKDKHRVRKSYTKRSRSAAATAAGASAGNNADLSGNAKVGTTRGALTA